MLKNAAPLTNRIDTEAGQVQLARLNLGDMAQPAPTPAGRMRDHRINARIRPAIPDLVVHGHAAKSPINGSTTRTKNRHRRAHVIFIFVNAPDVRPEITRRAVIADTMIETQMSALSIPSIATIVAGAPVIYPCTCAAIAPKAVLTPLYVTYEIASATSTRPTTELQMLTSPPSNAAKKIGTLPSYDRNMMKAATNSVTPTPRFPMIVAIEHTPANDKVKARPEIVVAISAGQDDDKKRA
jgi:hypothetical protein